MGKKYDKLKVDIWWFIHMTANNAIKALWKWLKKYVKYKVLKLIIKGAIYGAFRGAVDGVNEYLLDSEFITEYTKHTDIF